jgi:hypothetical protein
MNRVDPMPDPWWIGSQIAYVIAATMGGGGKRWSQSDFDPREIAQPPKRRLTVEETRSFIDAIIR